MNKALDLLNMSPQKLNELARSSAETIAQKDRLKTHQLRNVFSAIEKMRTIHKKIIKLRPRLEGKSREDQPKDFEKLDEYVRQLEMQLIMLKPKLAYAAGRQKSVRYNFFPLVEDAVNGVDKALESKKTKDHDKAYSRFFALMESVVAYHKFYEK
jgi:CRISPR-associated protein Csm2